MTQPLVTIRFRVNGPRSMGDPGWETARANDLVALFGDARCGKTSLLHQICGLNAHRSGLVETSHDLVLWETVALIPQTVVLANELTVLENVLLPFLRLQEPSPDQRAHALESVNVSHLSARLASELSVGERHRVMVARAVLSPALVLLADQPTANQDDANAARIIDTLASQAAEGRVVVVTAALDESGLLRSRATQAYRLSTGSLWFSS